MTVIAEFPNHPLGVMPREYRGRSVEDDRSNPYRVLRVWVKANEEKTQMTRLSFYLSFMALAAAVAPLAGPRRRRVATTPPLFTGLAGAAIARMKRAPFVLDVRDLWPAAADEPQPDLAGLDAPQAREPLERRLYRAAAAVVAVTQPFCEHIDAIRGKPPTTALIPNGTLEQFFDVEPDDGVRSELGATGRRVPRHVRRHARDRAGAAVACSTPRRCSTAMSQFAFVGEGPMKQHARRRAAPSAASTTSTSTAGADERDPADARRRAMRCSCRSRRIRRSRQFVPSKLIDFMAVGRPVVLSAAGESARLLERGRRRASSSPPEDPDALAEAVRWLAGAPGGSRGDGRSAVGSSRARTAPLRSGGAARAGPPRRRRRSLAPRLRGELDLVEDRPDVVLPRVAVEHPRARVLAESSAKRLILDEAAIPARASPGPRFDEQGDGPRVDRLLRSTRRRLEHLGRSDRAPEATIRLAIAMYSNSFVGEPKKRVPSGFGTCGESRRSRCGEDGAVPRPAGRARSA